MTLSQLQATIQQFRQQLAAREQAALQLLAQQHAQTVQIIDARMQTLWTAVEARLASNEAIPVEWVLEHMRMYSIQQMISGQIDSYGAYAQHLAFLLQQEGVKLGSAAAQALLAATVPPGVAFSFGIPSQDALIQFIGATKAGNPLATLFDGFGAEAAQSVKQTLLTGLTLGHNPREVAQSVAQDLNVSQWRAQTIARTEMNRAYRGAALESYRANSDVVSQWRWTAALSSRTCAACLAMDGQLFDLDEELDDHPCGRCFAVPVTKNWSDILGDEVDTSDIPDLDIAGSMPTGADWFDNQSADVQRNILGKSGYALYANGDATLKDFVTVTNDKQWGKSIQQTPVKELATKG